MSEPESHTFEVHCVESNIPVEVGTVFTLTKTLLYSSIFDTDLRDNKDNIVKVGIPYAADWPTADGTSWRIEEITPLTNQSNAHWTVTRSVVKQNARTDYTIDPASDRSKWLKVLECGYTEKVGKIITLLKPQGSEVYSGWFLELGGHFNLPQKCGCAKTSDFSVGKYIVTKIVKGEGLEAMYSFAYLVRLPECDSYAGVPKYTGDVHERKLNEEVTEGYQPQYNLKDAYIFAVKVSETVTKEQSMNKVYTGAVVSKTRTVAAGEGVSTGVQTQEVVYSTSEAFTAPNDEMARTKVLLAAIKNEKLVAADLDNELEPLKVQLSVPNLV